MQRAPQFPRPPKIQARHAPSKAPASPLTEHAKTQSRRMDCNWQKMPSTIAGSFGGMALRAVPLRQAQPAPSIQRTLCFHLAERTENFKGAKDSLGVPIPSARLVPAPPDNQMSIINARPLCAFDLINRNKNPLRDH